MEHDLYQEILDCKWLMDKIRSRRSYAQNLYAAWCNMQWQKIDVMPILKNEYWSASWRSAGGMVAELHGANEDYMDYYCSGMKGGASYDTDDDDEYFEKNQYVSEGQVTEEIRADLLALGWQPVPYDDDFV
jgi:hypothetical protein